MHPEHRHVERQQQQERRQEAGGGGGQDAHRVAQAGPQARSRTGEQRQCRQGCGRHQRQHVGRPQGWDQADGEPEPGRPQPPPRRAERHPGRRQQPQQQQRRGQAGVPGDDPAVEDGRLAEVDREEQRHRQQPADPEQPGERDEQHQRRHEPDQVREQERPVRRQRQAEGADRRVERLVPLVGHALDVMAPGQQRFQQLALVIPGPPAIRRPQAPRPHRQRGVVAPVGSGHQQRAHWHREPVRQRRRRRRRPMQGALQRQRQQQAGLGDARQIVRRGTGGPPPHPVQSPRQQGGGSRHAGPEQPCRRKGKAFASHP